MTDLTISVDPSRGAKNPYELALWVVTGVLILGPVPAMTWAQGVFSSHQGGWTGQPSVDIQIAQSVNFIASSALSGGIILAGIALAFRALTFSRRTADTHLVPSSDAAPPRDPEPVATGLALDKNRQASVPVDHTPYMRPQVSE
jgi:hypothetical protein